MANLIRAKVKAIEHIPEEMKCCPEFIASLQADTEEMLLDLSRIIKRPDSICPFCGMDHGPTIEVLDVGVMAYEDFRFVDLDETGIKGEKYVEAHRQ